MGDWDERTWGRGGGQETRRDSVKEHIERSIKKGRR